MPGLKPRREEGRKGGREGARKTGLLDSIRWHSQARRQGIGGSKGGCI